MTWSKHWQGPYCITIITEQRRTGTRIEPRLSKFLKLGPPVRHEKLGKLWGTHGWLPCMFCWDLLAQSQRKAVSCQVILMRLVGSRERMRKECARVIVIPKTWAFISFMMSCFSRWIDFASAWCLGKWITCCPETTWLILDEHERHIFVQKAQLPILGGWSNSLCPWFDPSNPHGTARASASYHCRNRDMTEMV